MAGIRKRKFSELSNDLESKTDVSNSLISAVENGQLQVVRELINSFGLSYSPEWFDGYILLRNAVKSNKHRDVIKLLITSGSKVNRNTHRFDDTPLHYSVLNDDIEIVKMLLDRSANIEAKNNSGQTPLHIAAENVNSNITEHLLTRGANVNCVCKLYMQDYTPLHFAAKKGCEKTVKVLLRRGADSNTNFGSNGTSSTPLCLAIIHKREKIVKILLEHAANVKPQNRYSNVILYRAVSCGCSSEIVEHILEYIPIHPDYTNISKLFHTSVEKGYFKVVDELLKCGINVNMFNSLLRTSLHNAIKNKQEEVAALLIKYGANVNAKDDDEKIPILYAIENTDLKITKLLLTNGAAIEGKPEILNLAVKYKSKEIIEILLQYGADINASDEYGRTALHCCSNEDIAKLLLSREANVDAQNKKGETALYAATKNGYAKVVEVLLQYNCNVNLSNGDITPLHMSSENEGTTTMLLNKGADVNAKQEDGTTALHIAVLDNCKNTVEVLLNYGAKVEAKYEGNKTSIHLAAERNRAEIIEILLKYGADIDSRDQRGRTGLHLACKRGNKETVVALLKSGGDVNILNESKHTAIEYCMQHSDRWKFIETSEVLKEHFIKLKSANLYLHTNNLEVIENIDNSNLRNECNKELENMKDEKIGNISFHDILTKNINQMTHYARNEDIIQTLKSDDFKTKFPIYASMMNNHFKKAVVRMELLEHVRTFINFPLPDICTEKIFTYLNTEDLRDIFCLDTSAVEETIDESQSELSNTESESSDCDSSIVSLTDSESSCYDCYGKLWY